jgi:hypothetical protein
VVAPLGAKSPEEILLPWGGSIRHKIETLDADAPPKLPFTGKLVETCC